MTDGLADLRSAAAAMTGTTPTTSTKLIIGTALDESPPTTGPTTP
ncbi:MAG: hypothetical protein U0Q07_13065 [Acidimicrobiales bacterium]